MDTNAIYAEKPTQSRARMIKRAAGVTVIVLSLTGCGPTPESSPGVARGGDGIQSVQQTAKSEVSPEKIASDIVGRVVRVADSSGSGDENEWKFEPREFRRIVVLERKATDKGQTLIVFLATQNNASSDEEQVQVSGKLQLDYEQKAGKWVLTNIENLSLRYSVGVAT